MGSKKLGTGSSSEVCKPNYNFDVGQFSLSITRQPSVLVKGENVGAVTECVSVPPKLAQPCHDLTVMMIFAQDCRDEAQRVRTKIVVLCIEFYPNSFS